MLLKAIQTSKQRLGGGSRRGANIKPKSECKRNVFFIKMNRSELEMAPAGDGSPGKRLESFHCESIRKCRMTCKPSPEGHERRLLEDSLASQLSETLVSRSSEKDLVSKCKVEGLKVSSGGWALLTKTELDPRTHVVEVRKLSSHPCRHHVLPFATKQAGKPTNKQISVNLK